MKRSISIILAILLLLPCLNAQIPTTDLQANSTLSQIQASMVMMNKELGFLTKNEVQEMKQNEKRELQKLQEHLMSVRGFMQNANQARQTIRILTQILCMLDDIANLYERRSKFGFYTCYGNIEFTLYRLQIQSNIATLNSLFQQAITTSGVNGLDRNKAWKDSAESTQELKDKLDLEKRKLEREVAIYESKEHEMEALTERVVSTWRMM